MVPVVVDVAQRAVEALERSNPDGLRPLLSEQLADWDPEPWLVDRWRPRLRSTAGDHRQVVAARRVNDVMARVVVAGDRGQAFVSVLFDELGTVAGLSIDSDERDGQVWVVIGCADGDDRTRLASFYERLVDAPLGFGEGGSRPPRWPDPEHPVHLHLDVAVADLSEAERAVAAVGANQVAEFDDHSVWCDPAGHPLCLIPREGTQPGDHIGLLESVVLDCAEPEPLAAFWSAVLDLPRRVGIGPDRIRVSDSDGGRPGIVAQRIENYHPPRWPNPDRPAQMHFDLGYDDRRVTERLAVSMGAVRLPPQGGSCPVFADPAGHPFCLCYKGE